MILSNGNILSPSTHDRFLTGILWCFSLLASLILGLILFFLVYNSLPVLWDIGISKFFLDSSWHPSEALFNLTPMLVGSLLIMLGAILLAAPLGIVSAIFCRFYAPKVIAVFYQSLIELLSGIPSVVYGFWGLVTLVPLIQKVNPPGTSLLAGIIVLALMILPTVSLIADATFANLPKEYFQGAAGLSLSRFTLLTQIILPASKSGLLTSVILAAGRAIGETMAILMICGNIAQIPDSLFSPVRTLTANIALEMAYAMGNHRSALFVSGLLLMVIIFALVSLAHRAGKGSVYA